MKTALNPLLLLDFLMRENADPSDCGEYCTIVLGDGLHLRVITPEDTTTTLVVLSRKELVYYKMDFTNVPLQVLTGAIAGIKATHAQ